jgi:hypothetical protein
MCRFRSALRLPCAPPRFIALAPCGLHESRAASAPGADPAINKAFQQPDVAGWAGRLEGESRETYARRDGIVEANVATTLGSQTIRGWPKAGSSTSARVPDGVARW